jgi:multidrug efflux pump subunit AcrA (membrane-fusion protein)
MMSFRIKTALFALALCWGLTASAQDTAAQATPTEEAAASAEAAAASAEAAANAAEQAAEAAEASAEAAQASAEAAAPATGRIIFFRPRKMMGGAIVFKVREGDAVLGKLSSGSFFTVDVPAGTHSYYAKSEGKDDTLVMEVEAGETYYVSGSISMGVMAGQGNLSPSDQAAFDEANKKKKLKDRSGEKLD